MNEKNLLNICYHQVEKKLGWGDGKHWVNSQYEELHKEIFKATKINISVSTLKRIFGKHATKENYRPQKATKEALAKYLGYGSWADFKKKHTQPTPTEHSKIKVKSIFITLLLVLISGIGIFLLPKEEAYHFSPRNLEGENFHTIHIDYDIQDGQSYKIDFGVDTIMPLNADKKTIAHYFQAPGLYYGKIYRNDKTVQRFTTEIKSNGWQSYLYTPGNKRYYPVSHIPNHIEHGMNISDSIITTQPIDTSKSYWTAFCKSIESTYDKMDFEIVLKNPSELFDVRCNHITIELFFQEGKVQLYFVKDGCSKWVQLQFGDEVIEGEYHDLAAFGDDFSYWRAVNLKIDKTYEVQLDNTPIYSFKRIEKLGHLKALRIAFSGTGNIKSIDINEQELLSMILN